MIDLAKLYARNHRDQQYMIVGTMMVALLGSLAPRYERALFVTGGRAQPAAFAAIAPPPVAFNGLFDGPGSYSTLRGARNGVPRGAGQTDAVPDGLDPADLANEVPGNASPVGGASQPAQLAALDPSGAGLTGGPLAGSGPLSFGPGAPVTSAGAPGNPGTPGNPTTPGGGTGGSNTAPITPVGPVPEPSTWAMMLIGFFGLGVLLRHARRQSVQLESIPRELDRAETR